MSMADDFNFNDEFFLSDLDKKRLEERFPNVHFAFYCEEASSLFNSVDTDAKASKTGFQHFGLAAVGFAVLALVIAAADPIFLLPASKTGAVPDMVPKVVAGLAATAGLLSILIAALGLGMGARKKEWQKKRLIGERLRQWQAQYICAHITEITAAASSTSHVKAYIRKRAADFGTFKADHVDNVGARLQEVNDERYVVPTNHRGADSGFNLWTNVELDHGSQRSLAESPIINTGGNKQPILKELFDAYDAIRFRAQEDYTRYMLGKESIKTHPRVQEDWFKKLGLFTITTIVALHIIVLCGVLFDVSALKSPIIHFLVLSTALIGLGVRVLEDGFQPTSHVNRLQDYLEAVSKARQRFREAETAGAKLLEMRALEEAAAREFLSFMRTINASRYVL